MRKELYKSRLELSVITIPRFHNVLHTLLTGDENGHVQDNFTI